MPAFAEAPFFVGASLPDSHDFVEVRAADVEQVAEDTVRFGVFKSLCHSLDDAIVKEHVIAVENANRIAACHGNAFVHGVIDSPVRLADPAHLSVEPTFVLLDDLERFVG